MAPIPIAAIVGELIFMGFSWRGQKYMLTTLTLVSSKR